MIQNNTSTHVTPHISYLDVEFKVFIHGKDVIEDILSDARNDTHLVRVVQLTLKHDFTDINHNLVEMSVASQS